MNTDSRLPVEILKLLLQVAWADDRIEEAEAEQIWSVAQAAGISEDDRHELAECLAGRAPLPPPDLGYLRDHKQAAYAAAQRMILLSDEVARGELLVLEQIRVLLGDA
ncbi:MAG: hypothetical protein Tsb0020_20740 [Haliangiales bacterium]